MYEVREHTPANMALRLHINVSINRPPDRTWCRPPGRQQNKWLESTSYDTIPPERLETSGGVLSTVDTVVQRRDDGPRRLRDSDDDDDDDDQSINQSINVKFVGRRYTTRPGAPAVVSGKHDHKVHS